MPEPAGDSTLWWEVHVRCSPSPDAASEMAGSILREACTAGLAEAADGWLAYLPDHAAAIALAQQIEGVTGLQCTVRLSEEAEWSAWRYAFRPQDISRRLRIVPVYDVSAHLGREAGPAAAAGRETAYIEPGLAFGTGEHPTTANCLRLLAAHLRPGDTVLDVGTGSGILAIAAATLGASRCLGIDIDPIACRSAAANLALNPKVTGRVEFACMDAGALPGFDLAGGAATPGGVRPGGFSMVLANLTTDLLVRLLPVLAGLMAAGGCLILSGIGIDRAQELAGPLAASGLTTVTSISEHGWLALLCRRSGR